MPTNTRERDRGKTRREYILQGIERDTGTGIERDTEQTLDRDWNNH